MRQERDPPEPRFRRLGLTARAGNQIEGTEASVPFLFWPGTPYLTEIKVCRRGRG